MREMLDGLIPRICARLDCVMSRSVAARITAPVNTRRGSGLGFGWVRGTDAYSKNYVIFILLQFGHHGKNGCGRPAVHLESIAASGAIPISVVEAGSGRLLFSLMLSRSSLAESAFRIASS